MGGIPCDANGQVIADAQGTPVVGFFAAGECACISVHGANRLGTNSLLDASVFGRRSGFAIAEFIKGGAKLYPIAGDPAERNRQRIRSRMDNPGKESIDKIADELKTTMTVNCGVFRTGEKLQIALQDIKRLEERFTHAPIRDKSSRFNTDMLGALETEHLLDFSEVIVAGAIARTECRGAHWRTDHPARDDQNWLKHTLALRQASGEGPKLDYKPVNINYEKYPPQERKY
jgi:succinate dehydrogenase / fumarate reductase flavoprotein subunit